MNICCINLSMLFSFTIDNVVVCYLRPLGIDRESDAHKEQIRKLK